MSVTASWERLAALEGGTVSALTTATTADGVGRVFAATAVGVFQSAGAGRSWRPLGDGGAVAGAEVVVASPRYAVDGLLFAGGRDGLFRWQEGSTGWTHLLSSARVLGLAVVPGAESGLTLLAGTEDDGVLISRDGGRTWTGANPGLLDLTILALAASPDFAQDGLAFAATTTGLYRTRNGAESWRQVDLDWDDVAIQCLAISPDFAADRVVLAGTEEQGLLRSDDAGRSWEQAPDLADRMVNSLSFGPDGQVVVGTDAGLAFSVDRGQAWTLIGDDLGGIASAVACRDGDRSVLLAGLPESGAPRQSGLPHTGVARSADGGETWTAANTGLAARLAVGLTLSPDFEWDQTIFLTSLDTGPSISHDGGLSWAAHDSDLETDPVPDLSGAPFDGAAVIVFARSPGYESDGILYAVTGADAAGRATLWRTTDRGQGWDRWLEIPGVPAGSAVQVVALPTNQWGDTVVVGFGGQVYRPRQGSWEVSGGRRRPVWDTVELPAAGVAGRAVAVTGLAASPDYASDRTLFAATSAGVYISRGGGALFIDWSDDLEPAATVAVAPSPAYARDRLVYALGLGGTIWRRHDR